MANPVFKNQPAFGDSATKYAQDNYVDQYRQQYGQQGGAQYGQQVSPQYGQQHVQQEPIQPYIGATDTYRQGALTYADVVVKTAGLLAVVIISGAYSWYSNNAMVLIVGFIGGLIFGLINAFRKSPSPALISLYALFQGLFLGGISRIYESSYSGIIGQAVLATAATIAAVLALHTSGKFRVTQKFRKWVFTLTLGYAIFVVINLLFSVFGAGGAWGFRNGTLGLVIGLFAVGLAAAFLLIDFDDIRKGVEAGVDAKFAWAAGFALLVTIIWMYIEFLRLLAIFRD